MPEMSILFTLGIEVDATAFGGVPQLSDRFIKIPKYEMLGFIGNVEHSIAVTERKILNGAIQ